MLQFTLATTPRPRHLRSSPHNRAVHYGSIARALRWAASLSLTVATAPATQHHIPLTVPPSTGWTVTATSATVFWQPPSPLITAPLTYRFEPLPGPSQLPATDLRVSETAAPAFRLHMALQDLLPGHSYVLAIDGLLHGTVVQRLGPIAVTTQPRANSPLPSMAPCSPHYYQPCLDVIYLNAINVARRSEGIAPMALPPDFYLMPATQQLFFILNAERTARGLPGSPGPSPRFTASVKQAVAQGTDPYGGPPGSSSIWFSTDNALEADYYWLYVDGFNGRETANIDCPSATAPGCWGHRDIILGDYGAHPEVAAYATDGPYAGAAALFFAGCERAAGTRSPC
jgi:hypothetical protein